MKTFSKRFGLDKRQALGRLVKKFLGNTWLSRFIVGAFLGVLGINVLAILFVPFGHYLLRILQATPLIREWLASSGWPDKMLEMVMALLLAVSVGSIALCFSFHRWRMTWVLSLIPVLTLLGLCLFIRNCNTRYSSYKVYGLAPAYVFFGIIYAPVAIGYGIRRATGRWTDFRKSESTRYANRVKTTQRLSTEEEDDNYQEPHITLKRIDTAKIKEIIEDQNYY